MSLKEMCLENIALSVMNAPPMMQEMIIDSTKKKIEKTVTNEVIEKIEQLLPWITDQILDDMVDSLTITRRIPVNYYFVYSHIDKRIINIAIKCAKLMFEKMQSMEMHVNRRVINMSIVDAYDPVSDDEYGYESNRFEDDGEEDDDKSFVSMRSM